MVGCKRAYRLMNPSPDPSIFKVQLRQMSALVKKYQGQSYGIITYDYIGICPIINYDTKSYKTSTTWYSVPNTYVLEL